MFSKLDIVDEVQHFSETNGISIDQLCLTGTSALVVADMAVSCNHIYIEVADYIFEQLKNAFPTQYGLECHNHLDEEDETEPEYEEFICLGRIHITVIPEYCGGGIEYNGITHRAVDALYGFKDWLHREHAHRLEEDEFEFC